MRCEGQARSVAWKPGFRENKNIVGRLEAAGTYFRIYHNKVCWLWGPGYHIDIFLLQVDSQRRGGGTCGFRQQVKTLEYLKVSWLKLGGLWTVWTPNQWTQRKAEIYSLMKKRPLPWSQMFSTENFKVSWWVQKGILWPLRYRYIYGLLASILILFWKVPI